MKGSVRKIFEMFSELLSAERCEKDSVAVLLENAKNEIREIRAGIDSAHDESVMEMYLYRLKAAEGQYRELLKMAKETKQKKTG
ncbi:MAG: hypothetical protein IJ316_00420 [Clostridia bacterium]|nr:hypothetical protein [Clostridia bacterium]